MKRTITLADRNPEPGDVLRVKGDDDGVEYRVYSRWGAIFQYVETVYGDDDAGGRDFGLGDDQVEYVRRADGKGVEVES